MIASGDWEGLSAEQAEVAHQLANHWRELDEGTQEKLLPQIVREVVFDSKPGTVAVTLADDAIKEFAALGS